MTDPASELWSPRTPGFRTFEATQWIGEDADWAVVADAVMQWQVKMRSGFTVAPASRATVDGNHWVTARFGPGFTVRDPVTLAGHPVSGEEAFVASRRPGGGVTA